MCFAAGLRDGLHADRDVVLNGVRYLLHRTEFWFPRNRHENPFVFDEEASRSLLESRGRLAKERYQFHLFFKKKLERFGDGLDTPKFPYRYCNT